MTRLMYGCVVAFMSCAVLGGPIQPPAGPVSPTEKPLGELEPRVAIGAANTPGDADSEFIISQSGSYYLTQSVSTTKENAILVTAERVTIDLNGFSLNGGAVADNGVAIEASNVTVRNGAIDSFRREGVCGTGFRMTRVEDLRVTNVIFMAGQLTGGRGIVVGESSSVRRCIVEDNGVVGISVQTGSSVVDCVANNNGSTGIEVRNSLVRGCVSIDNDIFAIRDLDANSTLLHNHAP